MEPIIILSIIFSVILIAVAIAVPFIMSVLDPHRIPDHLVNYYKNKKTQGLIIASIVAIVLIAIIWGYVFIWAI